MVYLFHFYYNYIRLELNLFMVKRNLTSIPIPYYYI